MNVIVYDIIEDNTKKNELISNNLICPKCKNVTLIDFKDFKINYPDVKIIII